MVSVEDMLHDSLEQLLNADNWMLARWEACKREETKVGAQEMKEDLRRCRFSERKRHPPSISLL